MTTATKIKLKRVQLGITQSKVCRETETEQWRLSLIERGLLAPTDKEREQLAKYLNLKPATLQEDASSIDIS